MNPDWLLAEHSNALDVIACQDPAESLARHARHLGLFVLELLGVLRYDDGDEDTPIFHAMLVAQQARVAFRYADAALRLEVTDEITRQAVRVRLVLDDEPEGPGPEWRARPKENT